MFTQSNRLSVDSHALPCLYSLTSSGTAISGSQASPVLSGVEAGSLDRGKAALERRNKKSAITGGGVADDGCSKATGRVEVTRVNPDSLIDQLLRATNLDDHSADEDSKHSKLPRLNFDRQTDMRWVAEPLRSVVVMDKVTKGDCTR